jgi:putative flippase GtrA
MPGTSEFPLAFDTFPVIDANTQEDTPGAEHDVVHANVHAALQALQAKVGVDGSTDAASLDARVGALEDAAGPAGVVHTTGDESIGGTKTFTASPIVPTPTAGDNSTKAASTAFIAGALAGYVATATFTWSNLGGKPTTLSGYGITDAVAASSVGAASGVAPLGGDSKVPSAYLPAAVVGQVEYQGTWNASTGAAPTATPSKGWYYVVTVAGSTSLSGITDWKVGDWAIYNGTAWDKVDNTDAIASWNGRTGAVVPAANDYTFAQIGSKPTTLAGYGITDAVAAAAFTWANLSGKPTTVSGFGITDAVDTANAQTIGGAKTFSVSPIVPTPTAGDSSTKAASTAFVTGALASYVTTANFTWANIGGKPTTLSGFGITDAVDTASAQTVGGTKTFSAAAVFANASYVNGSAGSNRYFGFRTAGVLRWDIGAGSSAESGSSAGSGFSLRAYDDAGTLLGSVFDVVRATRVLAFGVSPTAPTPTAGDNTTKVATTAFITSALASYVTTANFTFANLSGKPTTLSGYGITDAVAASSVGAASGVAPLGSDGKVPTAYLPTSVLGQVAYQGTWDASAGTAPTATPSKGWYYVVSVAGSTNLSGITDWKVGDWAIYNGSAWDKVDNTDAISSWNGRTGAVVPAAGDYTFAQIGSKPTTVSGYGITDAVDTANAQTIGGAKTFSVSPIVPTPTAGDSSTKAASTAFVTGALASYVTTANFTWANIGGKPTTLSGFGITDAVDIASTQTVGGAKTFTSMLAVAVNAEGVRLGASGAAQSHIAHDTNGWWGTNTYFSGGWLVDDATKPAFAFMQHLANDRWEWRHTAAGGSQTTVATLTGAGVFNAVGGLQSNGSAVVDVTTNQTIGGTKTFSAATVLANASYINGAAATARRMGVRTSGVLRWDFGGDGTAESGSNAGTQFVLNAYDDAGASLGSVFSVTRATRVFGFTVSPTAPTPTAGDNTTKVATTAFITGALASYVTTANFTFANLGGKPTTLSGYGITDAVAASSVGAANGVAPLASDGKISTTYLPSSVLGQVAYQGTWDASAGAPTATPSKGWYYVVTVAGSTNLSGITDWKVGDWAIYNGTAWDKVDNTDAIASWNGRTGAVTPQSGDYTFAQIGSKPTTLAGYGITDAAADAAVVHQTGDELSIAGNKRFTNEVQTTSANSYRHVQGNYGTFWRNDGTNYWLLFTASGDQYGTFNSLRPLSVSLSSGQVTMQNGLSVTGGGVDLGSQAATGVDLSKHIALYGTVYGLNIINNTLQVVSNSKAFQFDGTVGDFIVPSTGSIIGSTKVLAVTASASLSSSNLNRAAEKSSTTAAVTLTIPAGLGTSGDSIPIVNSATAGNITVGRAAGVSLLMDGVDANITVAPGYARTLYRTATTDKWMVL